jgi:hypothetical protein
MHPVQLDNHTTRPLQSAPELARFLAEDPEAQQRAHSAYKRGGSASPTRLPFLDAEITEEEELVGAGRLAILWRPSGEVAGPPPIR